MTMKKSTHNTCTRISPVPNPRAHSGLVVAMRSFGVPELTKKFKNDDAQNQTYAILLTTLDAYTRTRRHDKTIQNATEYQNVCVMRDAQKRELSSAQRLVHTPLHHAQRDSRQTRSQLRGHA